MIKMMLEEQKKLFMSSWSLKFRCGRLNEVSSISIPTLEYLVSIW